MENNIKSYVMNDGEIYKLINDSISTPLKWSSKEMSNGKLIDIFPEWIEQMPNIIEGYRKNKWKVWWFIHGNRQYLEFEYPVIWRKK